MYSEAHLIYLQDADTLILKIMKPAHVKLKLHFKEIQTQKDTEICI